MQRNCDILLLLHNERRLIMSIFINPVIYDCAPENTENREERELRTYRFLEELDIPFQRLDHGAAMTMEDCDDVDAALDIEHCKNLFLRNTQKTEFYLLLMPHHKKFKTAVLSKQIGTARLSFAEEEFMFYLTDGIKNRSRLSATVKRI